MNRFLSTLTSQASQFTPFGSDINPEINISGDLPANTKSLALVVRDPDAPRGEWYHWIVVNIPTNMAKIA